MDFPDPYPGISFLVYFGYTYTLPQIFRGLKTQNTALFLGRMIWASCLFVSKPVISQKLPASLQIPLASIFKVSRYKSGTEYTCLYIVDDLIWNIWKKAYFHQFTYGDPFCNSLTCWLIRTMVGHCRYPEGYVLQGAAEKDTDVRCAWDIASFRFNLQSQQRFPNHNRYAGFLQHLAFCTLCQRLSIFHPTARKIIV